MTKYHQQYSDIVKIPSKVAITLVKLTMPTEGKPNPDLENYIKNWTPNKWLLPEEPEWRQ